MNDTNNPSKVVLVTGGLGYIGSHTVVELIENGYEVEIIDNLSNSSIKCLERLEKITSKKIKFYEFDLLNYEKLEEVFNFSKTSYYAIIHFAGLKSVNESTKIPLSYYKNNLISSINVIELAIKYNCENFIFSSSACVYGSSSEPCKETFPLDPINTYGRTKLMIENILIDTSKSSNGKFKAIILRYFNPVGSHKSGLIGDCPNNIPQNLFAVIENHIKGKSEKLSIFGNDYNSKDKTAVRDYIHVVDLAQAHVVTLNKFKDPNLKTYDIFNLGTNNGLSVLEVITEYMKATGKNINFAYAGRREGDAEICVANAEKAKNELGWSSKLGVEEMCKDSYRWISLNPNGYD